MNRLVFLIFIALAPLTGVSQNSQNYYLPDYFSSVVMDHLALINPAYIHTDTIRASFHTLYKSRMGLLNEVSTQTAYADLMRVSGTVRQGFRVLIHNEREGPYIATPRVYGNYAVRVRITQDLSLAAGLSLGISSHSYSAPSGVGSGIAPDGNAGFIVRFRKTELGGASYQLFNNKVSVLNSQLLLTRYYQCYLQSEKMLSPFVVLKGNIWWRQQPRYDIVNTTVMLSYKNFFTVGLMYQYRRSISALTCFQFNTIRNPLILTLSYNSPFLNTVLVTSQSFELGLQYRILR